MKRDPLIRTRKYLETKNLWDDAAEKKAWEKARATVQEVIQLALKVEPPRSEDIFDHTFADLPAEIARQRDTRHTHSIGQDPEQIGLKPQPQHQEAAH